MKMCAKCGEAKPLTEYHKKADAPDGLRRACKACRQAERKAQHLRNLEHNRAVNRAWYAANAEKHNAKSRAWAKANPEKSNANAKKWQAANAERAKETARIYRDANPEKVKQAMANWRSKNKPRIAHLAAKRRAARERATPRWADLKAVESFYVSADALNMLTGEWHHVDHIVPLQSPRVCGLHVPANLQILPAFENQSKCNRAWPDMP